MGWTGLPASTQHDRECGMKLEIGVGWLSTGSCAVKSKEASIRRICRRLMISVATWLLPYYMDRLVGSVYIE